MSSARPAAFIDNAVEQLSQKYLLPERADEGYVIEPQRATRHGTHIVSVCIGIGSA